MWWTKFEEWTKSVMMMALKFNKTHWSRGVICEKFIFLHDFRSKFSKQIKCTEHSPIKWKRNFFTNYSLFYTSCLHLHHTYRSTWLWSLAQYQHRTKLRTTIHLSLTSNRFANYVCVNSFALNFHKFSDSARKRPSVWEKLLLSSMFLFWLLLCHL